MNREPNGTKDQFYGLMEGLYACMPSKSNTSENKKNLAKESYWKTLNCFSLSILRLAFARFRKGNRFPSAGDLYEIAHKYHREQQAEYRDTIEYPSCECKMSGRGDGFCDRVKVVLLNKKNRKKEMILMTRNEYYNSEYYKEHECLMRDRMKYRQVNEACSRYPELLQQQFYVYDCVVDCECRKEINL